MKTSKKKLSYLYDSATKTFAKSTNYFLKAILLELLTFIHQTVVLYYISTNKYYHGLQQSHGIIFVELLKLLPA